MSIESKTEPIYRRGQVEFALWKLFSMGSSADIPVSMLMRLKKLVDLDRSTPIERKQSQAFQSVAVNHAGTDAEFTVFDAFCLSLSVYLTDIGFKQSEVIFLLRNIRSQLRDEFEAIRKHGHMGRQKSSPRDFPGMPTTKRNGRTVADPRVFLVINKVEIGGLLTTSISQKADPAFLKPVVCRGIKALSDHLDTQAFGQQTALLLEISEPAHLVPKYLADAPVIRRGRKN